MENEPELQKLLKEIEDTRIKLNKLISESEDSLIDEEIIKISELLDRLLFKYHNLM